MSDEDFWIGPGRFDSTTAGLETVSRAQLARELDVTPYQAAKMLRLLRLPGTVNARRYPARAVEVVKGLRRQPHRVPLDQTDWLARYTDERKSNAPQH